MDEQWKPVPGFEDRYSVSDRGRCVRTLTRGGRSIWRALAGRIEGNGYVTFGLYNSESKQKHPLAHRVVWAAFRGPIPKGMEVNHKNGIKFDNTLINLELATRSENMLHGFRELGFSRNRLSGADHPKAKLREEDVLKILELRRDGTRRYLVAEQFNISAVAVRLIERGHNWGSLTGITPSNTPVFTSPSGLGSGNSHVRLTEDDIPKIFAMYREGLPQRQIAEHFGVRQQTIGRVLLRQRWGHLSIA